MMDAQQPRLGASGERMIASPSGSTRLYAHIGDPILQVQAPMLMNPLFRDAGMDAVMVAMQVGAADLAQVVQGLKRIGNLDGILVTVPHKFSVCGHADRCSVTVELAGAANALRREADGTWLAENFDGLGFVAGLRAQGHEPRGMRVALAGAGGAGVAIAAALVEAGVSRLAVADAVMDKACGLADRLNAWRAGVAVAGNWSASASDPVRGEADLLVNATALGMGPDDALPFEVRGLQPCAIVADIVMKPQQTRLLQAAAQAGLRTHEGMHMLAPQLPMYLDFFGASAARSHAQGAP
jgi:shikimate dehydrogenase